MYPNGYTNNKHMAQPVFDIRVYKNRAGTSPFKRWMNGIRDGKSRDVINQRITRMALGTSVRSGILRMVYWS